MVEHDEPGRGGSLHPPHGLESLASGPPEEFETRLRPSSFDEFIGQDAARRALRIAVTAARGRGEALDHVLFCGPPGLGKTTLAGILAHEMETRLHVTSGPTLERPGDLVGVLTHLERRDVLFVDEIHRLAPAVEEYLYAAMESFAVDVLVDPGPQARAVRIDIAPFTLIGATTREGLLGAPFRSRFGILQRLDPYPPEDIARILARTAGILGVRADGDALDTIAERSRGVPRVANRMLRRLRDVAEVEGDGRLDMATARKGFAMLGVDDLGLEALDRRILDVLVRAAGRPVGLKTLAVSIGEEEETIEEVYEPYLIRRGLLARTPRGRLPTDAARRHVAAWREARGSAPPGLLSPPTATSRP